jgi:uncharacterized protein
MNFRRLSGFVLMLALVWVGLSWHAASQLSRPPRRPLQAYHLTILATPTNHGIRVRQMTLSDGTPMLMCEPEHTPSRKGHRLRHELEKTGSALAAPGRIVGTLVLLHGRRGRKEDWLPAAERFWISLPHARPPRSRRPPAPLCFASRGPISFNQG